jgi:hypothetical protein
MSDEWKLPWEGGCRCAELRFRVTAAPFLSSACHCTGCQRMTGSAFTLSLGVPRDAFEVTKGEPVLGGVGDPPIHYHCPHCKSWVFTRPVEPAYFVNVRTAMLDDPSWARPYVELYRGEGFAWVSTGAKHSYDGMPAEADWPRLVAEYAKEGARP